MYYTILLKNHSLAKLLSRMDFRIFFVLKVLITFCLFLTLRWNPTMPTTTAADHLATSQATPETNAKRRQIKKKAERFRCNYSQILSA